MLRPGNNAPPWTKVANQGGVETIVFLDRGTVPVPFRSPPFPHTWKEYDATPPEDVVPRLKDTTIAITNKVRLRSPELEQLPKLKMIAVTATGHDCVDVDYCREHGIAVANVPGYASVSVAEHVFMMILALRRNLPAFREAVVQGAWQRSPRFALFAAPIHDLQGAVLGLVGYGQIAREVERRARAFGMEVLVADRKGTCVVRDGRVAFEEVLPRSDVISLHCPLNEQTHGLIGATELALMKNGAILINTARGGIVEDSALREALLAGRIAAGIDVSSQEPPPAGHPLTELKLPNLILTPHIAWASQQTLRVLAERVVRNIEAFVEGKPGNLVT